MQISGSSERYQSGPDDSDRSGCFTFFMIIVVLLLGVIAFFSWRIYDLLDSGDMLRNLLPF